MHIALVANSFSSRVCTFDRRANTAIPSRPDDIPRLLVPPSRQPFPAFASSAPVHLLYRPSSLLRFTDFCLKENASLDVASPTKARCSHSS